MSTSEPDKQVLLQQLRGRIGKPPGRGHDRPVGNPRRVLIEEFLAPQSLEDGLFVEWLAEDRGAGASTLAFLMARDEQQQGRPVVVIDPRREFYPPAAAALGLNAADLIVVQPRSQADVLWAWEQSLRSAGTTVLGPLDEARGPALRRLKLAVEKGRGLALLLRPFQRPSEPSWADLRLLARPVGSDPGGPIPPVAGPYRVRCISKPCMCGAGLSVAASWWTSRMKRQLCLWFPNWPVQRLKAAHPALRNRPLVLFQPCRGRDVVTACCRSARAAGVRPDLPLAEAKVLLGDSSHRGVSPEFLPDDPPGQRSALQQLAWDCEAFSPRVGLEDDASPVVFAAGYQRMRRLLSR